MSSQNGPSDTNFTDEDEEKRITDPRDALAKSQIGSISLPAALEQQVVQHFAESDVTIRELREDVNYQLSLLRSMAHNPEFDRPRKKKTDADTLKSPVLSFKYDRKQVPQYGPREVDAFLAARLPSSYAITERVLREIQTRSPGFNPKSLLDFGCGPGTGLWATTEVFKNLERVMAIDISDDMLRLASRFQIHASRLSHTCQIKYQRYLPMSSKSTQYDLVILGNVLGELPSDQIRMMTLDALWNKCAEFMVLIEPGTPEGFRIISEARMQLLRRVEGHVVAPCPHDRTCPLYKSTKAWCHFKQRNQMPHQLVKIKQGKKNFEDGSFSYLVIRRGKRPTSMESLEQEAAVWPRIVRSPTKVKKHVYLDLCTSEGEIVDALVSKTQHDDTYKQARKARWGDLWPHEYKVRQIKFKKSNDEEQ